LSIAFSVAAGLVLLGALPAAAHGEYASSDPEAGAVLKEAPDTLTLTLTEAAARGTTVRVFDGCHENLVTDTALSDTTVEASLAEGQPGIWNVRFRSVSGVDGHANVDVFQFEVKGRKDCGSKKRPRDKIAGGEDTIIESDDPPDNGGFPVMAFAIASVVILGLALVLRRATAK
jgi:methionine-rich copper-binding protein CopC